MSNIDEISYEEFVKDRDEYLDKGYNPYTLFSDPRITRSLLYYTAVTFWGQRVQQIRRARKFTDLILSHPIMDIELIPDKYQLFKQMGFVNHVYKPKFGGWFSNYSIIEDRSTSANDMFLVAASQNNFEVIKKYLRTGFDINYKTETFRGATIDAVTVAFNCGHFDLVGYLLRNRARISFEETGFDDYPFQGAPFVRRLGYIFRTNKKLFDMILAHADVPLDFYNNEEFDMEMFLYILRKTDIQLSPRNYFFVVNQVEDEYQMFLRELYNKGVLLPRTITFKDNKIQILPTSDVVHRLQNEKLKSRA